LLLNVESGRFFLALNFLGFFCLLVYCVLKLLLLFFFLFYFYITTTTTTTITSSNVSEVEGTSETSYKLWSFEFQSFGGRKEWTIVKLVLLPTLVLGSTYTHTHTHIHTRFDCSTRFTPSDVTPTYICFPYTWALRLAFGLCTLMWIWACNHVMSSPCSSLGRRREKKKRSKRKNFLFSFLHSIAVKLIDVDCFTMLSPMQSPSVAISSNVHQCLSGPFHPLTSIHYHSSPSTYCILQIVCTMHICIQYHILQTICCVSIL